jgi:hypothetical protein
VLSENDESEGVVNLSVDTSWRSINA